MLLIAAGVSGVLALLVVLLLFGVRRGPRDD
jgi:hypothetical protein